MAISARAKTSTAMAGPSFNSIIMDVQMVATGRYR